jgi:hypothetical protein
MFLVVVDVGDHMETIAPLLHALRCTEPLAVQNLLSSIRSEHRFSQGPVTMYS